jgi:hypothetical protein
VRDPLGDVLGKEKSFSGIIGADIQRQRTKLEDEDEVDANRAGR